jgi:hypothetical protein
VIPRPYLLQILSKLDNLAVRLLDAGIREKASRAWAEAREDCIGSNNSFPLQSWHPLMHSFGAVPRGRPPIADVILTQDAIRILTGPDDQMHGGLQGCGPCAWVRF